MPASGGDPISSALRVTFSKTNGNDLEMGLESSAKRAMLQPIEFELTDCQSTVSTALKSKYTVINPPGKCKTNGLVGPKLHHKANGVVELPVPKVVLYPLDKVHLGYKGNVNVGLGMVNLGNTCYLNSTLQALFHVPAFVNWLREEPRHLKCEQNNESSMHPDDVMCAVIKTFKCSQQRSGSAIRPISVYSKLKAICKHLNQGTQEDAHEFMRYLLESIEKSFLTSVQGHKLENSSKETTPVNQIFGGYIRTEVVCLTCQAVSTTFQHFQDLPLDIRRASTLEEALSVYFERERLPDGEDAYKCDKCSQKVLATKKFSVERPPNVLSIQLKRFSAMNGKLTKQIQLPEYLNLSAYMSPSVQSQNPVRYKLVSLVSHVGSSANCGHYTAIALAADGSYYLFDDQLVRPVPLSTVLNTSAYLVLYEMERPFTPSAESNQPIVSVASTTSKTPNSDTHRLLSFTTSNLYSNNSPVKSIVSPSMRNPSNLSPNKPKLPLVPRSSTNNNTAATSPRVSATTAYHNNHHHHNHHSNSNSCNSNRLVPYESDGADEDSDVENKERVDSKQEKVLGESEDIIKSNSSAGWRVTATMNDISEMTNGIDSKGSNSSTNRLSRSPNRSASATSSATTSTSSWQITNVRSSAKEEDMRKPSTPRKLDNPNAISANDLRSPTKKRLKRDTASFENKQNDEQENGYDGGDLDIETENRALCEKIARESDKRKNIVNELLQNSHRGYGNNTVKSWDGTSSAMDRDLESERKELRKRNYDDDYNTELDRGKVKKIRTNNFGRDDGRPRFNPFQQRANQQQQWRNNGNGRYNNYNNSNSSNSYYKFNRFPQNCRQWNNRKSFRQSGRKYYNNTNYYQSRY